MLRYADASGDITERSVEPVALAATNGHWYLLAWCRLRQGPRWFRTTRITSAHLTAEPAPDTTRPRCSARPPMTPAPSASAEPTPRVARSPRASRPPPRRESPILLSARAGAVIAAARGVSGRAATQAQESGDSPSQRAGEPGCSSRSSGIPSSSLSGSSGSGRPARTASSCADSASPASKAMPVTFAHSSNAMTAVSGP